MTKNFELYTTTENGKFYACCKAPQGASFKSKPHDTQAGADTELAVMRATMVSLDQMTPAGRADRLAALATALQTGKPEFQIFTVTIEGKFHVRIITQDGEMHTFDPRETEEEADAEVAKLKAHLPDLPSQRLWAMLNPPQQEILLGIERNSTAGTHRAFEDRGGTRAEGGLRFYLGPPRPSREEAEQDLHAVMADRREDGESFASLKTVH